MRVTASFCIVGALLVGVSAAAQSVPPADQLPMWGQAKWKGLAKSKGLEISTRLNPFVWRADFDGDGSSDLAIAVRHIATRKEGIALILRRAKSSHVLGAGTSFSNGGDDFSWIDIWGIEERGSTQRSGYDKTVKLQADGILVAKESSASALIYLKSGKPTWQQQGD